MLNEVTVVFTGRVDLKNSKPEENPHVIASGSIAGCQKTPEAPVRARLLSDVASAIAASFARRQLWKNRWVCLVDVFLTADANCKSRCCVCQYLKILANNRDTSMASGIPVLSDDGLGRPLN